MSHVGRHRSGGGARVVDGSRVQARTAHQAASGTFGGLLAPVNARMRTKAKRTVRRQRPARTRETAESPSPRGAAPEGLAQAAVAKAVHEALPDERVRLDLTVSLRTADAERLTALAITRGQNRDALVAEILESYLRDSPRPGHDTPGVRRESADGEHRSSG